MEEQNYPDRIKYLGLLERDFAEGKKYMEDVYSFLTNDISFFKLRDLIDNLDEINDISKNTTLNYIEFTKLSKGKYEPFTNVLGLFNLIENCGDVLVKELLLRGEMGASWDGKCYKPNPKLDEIITQINQTNEKLFNMKKSTIKNDLRECRLEVLGEQIKFLVDYDKKLKSLVADYLLIPGNSGIPTIYDEARAYGKEALDKIKQGINENRHLGEGL
ncbi:MAG: hypothetical protein AABW67_03985 [Nanoarchaeota archaeon]